VSPKGYLLIGDPAALPEFNVERHAA